MDRLLEYLSLGKKNPKSEVFIHQLLHDFIKALKEITATSPTVAGHPIQAIKVVCSKNTGCKPLNNTSCAMYPVALWA